MKATKTYMSEGSIDAFSCEREIQRYKGNEILLTTNMYIRKYSSINEIRKILTSIKIFFSRYVNAIRFKDLVIHYFPG